MYFRIVLWPLAMAYVAFLFTYEPKNSSLSMLFTIAFLAALFGFLVGLMFSARKHRREQAALGEKKRDRLEQLKRV